MNKQRFIKTTDEHTAEILRDAGFQELAKENNKWVFLNDADKMSFSIDEVKNIQKTDILHF